MAITLSGTEVFLSDLERMIPSDTNVDAALAEGAEVIAREMRQLAPVKSGKLKNAIKVGKARNGRNGRTITVGIHRRDIDLSAKDGHYYPAYVEYGHGGPRPAPPHPFIRPAFDLKKDEAWNTVKQAVIDQMNAKGL
jgi:HK97 gp10 family phage protein